MISRGARPSSDISNDVHTGNGNDGKVLVEFLLNIRGSRAFPLSSKRKPRFDAGANRCQRIPKEDALELIQRFGEKAFRVITEG